MLLCSSVHVLNIITNFKISINIIKFDVLKSINIGFFFAIQNQIVFNFQVTKKSYK
jgi:hypothetical protein